MNEMTRDMVKVNSVDGVSLITEFWAVQWETMIESKAHKSQIKSFQNFTFQTPKSAFVAFFPLLF